MRLALYGITLCLLAPGSVIAQSSSPFNQAEQAIQAATQADADQYASDLIAQARQRLAQAQLFNQDRHQQHIAPLIAAQATADADLAYAQSKISVLQSLIAQCNIDLAQLKSANSVKNQGTDADQGAVIQ